MDIVEYLNQDEYYFSESQGQLIRIDEMPFQQAFFSHRKLINTLGLKEYGGTHLYQAFYHKLCPRPAEIRAQLEKYGKACHAVTEPGRFKDTNGTRVRGKMYGAAKTVGKKVTTHLVTTASGLYMECVTTVDGISVRGQAV